MPSVLKGKETDEPVAAAALLEYRKARFPFTPAGYRSLLPSAYTVEKLTNKQNINRKCNFLGPDIRIRRSSFSITLIIQAYSPLRASMQSGRSGEMNAFSLKMISPPANFLKD